MSVDVVVRVNLSSCTASAQPEVFPSCASVQSETPVFLPQPDTDLCLWSVGVVGDRSVAITLKETRMYGFWRQHSELTFCYFLNNRITVYLFSLCTQKGDKEEGVTSEGRTRGETHTHSMAGAFSIMFSSALLSQNNSM